MSTEFLVLKHVWGLSGFLLLTLLYLIFREINLRIKKNFSTKNLYRWMWMIMSKTRGTLTTLKSSS